MRLALFSGVTIAALLILWFEWPRMKAKPIKDKAALVSLLLIGWLLTMLDLPNTPGPTTLLEAIFKPFRGLVEK
ncbi:hypothetical protein [Paenibacillus sp. LHD-38]|uniref:hypothetical protein n=1 Tax=Paenibacillus sp. LHD-38 TaxID=3072143 RepID=UPI00280F74B7|nr:hypothetical protein [Paenibacillus sp. LHD-38]MDQ8734179.1 hypothetical protein [Paenibacillus sp. LHD-38]